jgi:hypothetical protein
MELSRNDVERRVETLRRELDSAEMPAAVRGELAAFEAAAMPPSGLTPGALDLVVGEVRMRLRLTLLRRQLRDGGVDVRRLHALVGAAAERATLTRRLAHLQRTRRLLDLWHVFHRPLVSLMFVIVALHVGIAVFFGYVDFGPR